MQLRLLLRGRRETKRILPRRWSSLASSLSIHPTVAEALAAGKPVVALESTIISHGMPYPDNLRTATEVEDIVRNEGCVPATIAILNGTIRVGLDAQDLETLARTGRQAHKTSRRDLALVVSQKLTGATTVSSTIMIAHAAGIPIFVTGGIGGVHRGAETSLDISADLTELGRTPVAVVCAGCKSILDIEKTLEFLETQGVPVVTHGPNKNFPAFYTPKSGHQSMASLPLIEDCAELVRSNRELELQTGMVIAVPIPKKDVVQNADKMEELIKSAVQELKLKGIKGKEVTPYLLAKMKALTGGDSLRANIALVKNNARVGSRIAKALSELDKKAPGQKSTTKNTRHEDRNQKKRPLIIGGTVMDVSAHYKSSTPIEATSNLGRIQYSVGGVGRNVAEACQRTGGSPRFISAVGDDFIGHGLLDELSTLGLTTEHIRKVSQESTASYSAFFTSKGDLVTAVADMSLIESLQLSESQLDTIDNNTSIVCMDANLAEEQMARVVQRCQQWNVPLIFEPTSAPKATKLVNVIKRLSKRPPLYITPDLAEAKVIAAAIQSDTKMQRREWDESMVPPSITKSEIRHIAAVIASCFDKVIFKMGRNGVLLSQKCAETRFVHWDHLTPSVVKSSVVSVTGAGDSLVGALCSGVTLDPDSFPKDLSKFARMVKSSMTASELSLDTSRAVSELLGPDIFKKLQ